MKILLIHQYFLGKNQGGGSRFNEMAKIWADEGHSVTVIAGMPPLSQRKKILTGKANILFMRKMFYKNTDVFRCHVSRCI